MTPHHHSSPWHLGPFRETQRPGVGALPAHRGSTVNCGLQGGQGAASETGLCSLSAGGQGTSARAWSHTKSQPRERLKGPHLIGNTRSSISAGAGGARAWMPRGHLKQALLSRGRQRALLRRVELAVGGSAGPSASLEGLLCSRRGSGTEFPWPALEVRWTWGRRLGPPQPQQTPAVSPAPAPLARMRYADPSPLRHGPQNVLHFALSQHGARRTGRDQNCLWSKLSTVGRTVLQSELLVPS